MAIMQDVEFDDTSFNTDYWLQSSTSIQVHFTSVSTNYIKVVHLWTYPGLHNKEAGGKVLFCTYEDTKNIFAQNFELERSVILTFQFNQSHCGCDLNNRLQEKFLKSAIMV